MATSATVNGKPAAQVMFVMGSDEGGLTHPDWQQNLSWALKLQVQMERQYPGLTRPLSLRPERYNEHATPGSVLLEVGTAGDTLKGPSWQARPLPTPWYLSSRDWTCDRMRRTGN